MSQLFELFPTPLMRIEGLLDAAQAAALSEQFIAGATTGNPRSPSLSHTRILTPGDHPLLAELARRIGPHLVSLGQQMFGERLTWRIKEMWANVLQPGGFQSVHNHANCFISGVLYLTESDASARTVFVRSLGGRDFVFANTHAGTELGPFNADRWIGPDAAPGDLVLFPSHLLHEVPPNRGDLRVTLAFNAIPERLDAWGYAISFSA